MKKLIMHPVFAGPLIIVGLALLIVGASLASDVTRAYENLAGWRRHAETFDKAYPEVFAEQAPGYAVIIEKRSSVLEKLVLRLEAIAQGLPDPGVGPAAAAGAAGD